ncbi:Aste57867_21573 [Aphanomyces stellatus]|uniref:Aste57867_21573 protein n=1 Tax=Aphanomyces stellatus TaxID=120398 RepID=A0A485LIK5_9STRA|nr:hypothetical protein As57867_021504 [Aphanomyces stellatus]VFT98243.1 Aste57867_21573 [Aphanomyces stellatus]
MAPNQESSSLVSAWRNQMSSLTSPKSSSTKYSYSTGSYSRLSAQKERQVRRAVPVAIPEVFKVRDRMYVGGKNIPFTRYNTIACRRKVLKEDLDTIHESVYYLDIQWTDLIPEEDIMACVDPRRMMAITFIQ